MSWLCTHLVLTGQAPDLREDRVEAVAVARGAGDRGAGPVGLGLGRGGLAVELDGGGGEVTDEDVEDLVERVGRQADEGRLLADQLAVGESA